ncbi:MAG: hypothetical protein EBT45_07905, partial [Alphaproteobacteria bacterium]|nr:hypothetical protein [Alphaproteobacteria bacterium]
AVTGGVGASGVAYANASISGMGNVVSPQPSMFAGTTVEPGYSASGGHGTPFASPEKTGHEKIISSRDLATSYRNLFEDLQKQVELGAGAFDAQLAQFLGTGVTNSGVKKIRLGYKAPKVLADIHKKLSEQEPFEQLLSRFSMTESKKTEYRSLFRFA